MENKGFRDPIDAMTNAAKDWFEKNPDGKPRMIKAGILSGEKFNEDAISLAKYIVDDLGRYHEWIPSFVRWVVYDIQADSKSNG